MSRRMIRPGRRSNRERGAALGEIVVAIPLLFVLLFGVMELGRAIWLFNSISHGARQGTRYAIVHGSDSGRDATPADIETYVRGVIGLGDATVTTTWEPDNAPGSIVQVAVQAPFQPVMPILPPMTLESTSRLVISY